MGPLDILCSMNRPEPTRLVLGDFPPIITAVDRGHATPAPYVVYVTSRFIKATLDLVRKNSSVSIDLPYLGAVGEIDSLCKLYGRRHRQTGSHDRLRRPVRAGDQSSLFAKTTMGRQVKRYNLARRHQTGPQNEFRRGTHYYITEFPVEGGDKYSTPTRPTYTSSQMCSRMPRAIKVS